jgi:hypothetical protein
VGKSSHRCPRPRPRRAGEEMRDFIEATLILLGFWIVGPLVLLGLLT